MSYTNIEKETIINYNQEEKEANIYTHDKRLVTKLMNCCEKYPEQFKLIEQDTESKTFIIPKKYVSVRPPKIMSDEQKQKAGERMRAYRENLSRLELNNNTNEEGEKVG